MTRTKGLALHHELPKLKLKNSSMVPPLDDSSDSVDSTSLVQSSVGDFTTESARTISSSRTRYL